MNKYTARTKDGKPVLALVLEPGNLQKLREGKPIQVHVEDMFPDGTPTRLDILIGYTETPVADFRAMGETSAVALDERTPVVKEKRPICPHCTSTVEQLGVWKSDAPVALVFCVLCGGTLGAVSTKDVSMLRAPARNPLDSAMDAGDERGRY